MRTQKALPVLLCILATTSYLAVMACGNSSYSDDDDDANPPPTVNGNGCDATQTPTQNACVVDEAFGVFVSASASAGGADGTRAHPFATVQAGIDSAKTQKKRVYVCLGKYNEAVTLANAVSVFGNLDCTQQWTATTEHASLTAPTSPVVRADKITDATRFDSIDVSAPDGSATSKNSIAVLATGSPALTVANATIQSGAGFDGANGTDATQLTQVGNITGSANDIGGISGSANACFLHPVPAHCVANPAAGGTSSCSAPADAGVDAAAFNGGAGGGGGAGGACTLVAYTIEPGGFAGENCFGVGAEAARPGGAQPGSTATAAGAIFGGASAQPGNPGAAGINGTGGVSRWSNNQFLPGDGTAGHNGGPGQGGGGGTGTDPALAGNAEVGDHALGAGGAGGGAGGCPGLAGEPGTGGGASIVVITDSAVTFDTCALKSSNGGDAGKGSLGSSATSGGPPGTVNLNPLYTATAAELGGAAGGPGGDSGWSGNGSAGPSYCIASHGAAPVLKTSTMVPGAGGHGAPARTLGTKTSPATPDGASAATVTF